MVMASPVLCTASPSRSGWYSRHQASALRAVPGLNRARFDPAPELGGALRAAGGILVETREHDRFELGRDREPSRRQRLRLLVEVLAAHFYDRLAVEDIDPREQVVRDRPQGVDVSTGVDRVRLADGLRSHVLGRADDHAGAGQLDVSIDLETL